MLLSSEQIETTIEEIDTLLKKRGISPHGRPLNAAIEFGKRFGISMPLSELSPNAQVAKNWRYTVAIYDWYDNQYGDRIKMDPSSNAKMAIYADGDIWQLNLPLLLGECTVYAKATDLRGNPSGTLNACSCIIGLTDAKKRRLSAQELQEIVRQFGLGSGLIEFQSQ